MASHTMDQLGDTLWRARKRTRTAVRRMEASAKWVRTTNGRDLIRAVKAMIKAHPVRTVVGVLAVGVMTARALRRR